MRLIMWTKKQITQYKSDTEKELEKNNSCYLVGMLGAINRILELDYRYKKQ